ncbi:MAG: tRNA dihydrouridine synthase DusB [Acidimicrobiaceae bacterium]|nr:tRNA dihydrouridine synthase DusB [Acidimicrobiaceae bacterium]MBT5849465.1 tRNA dihydrouridine synthase DusB [Acidimicrobiaceae bacterium]
MTDLETRLSPSPAPEPPAGPGEFNALTIGDLNVWPPVVLAPMAGVTNAPFRALCRRYGAGLYVNQMITARALVEGHRKSLEMASFGPDESPRSIQLYGTDPYSIGEATKMLIAEQSVDHIDMNFGCPMKKVTRHGGGAALPWKREHYRRIVRAAVAAADNVPVTVKFRVGIDDNAITFLDAGLIAEAEGVKAVALHARTANQLYSGHADWRRITELKEAVTSIPVLGNGDIWEADDAMRMMRSTGADGVVVGRGCLGRPWLFGDLAAVFNGEQVSARPNLGEVLDGMVEHAELLCAWMDETRGIRDFRKHTGWYLKGFPTGNEVRRRLNSVESLDEMRELVGSLDRSISFPEGGMRMVRGHSGSSKNVHLPEGWLDERDDEVAMPRGAEALVSGG